MLSSRAARAAALIAAFAFIPLSCSQVAYDYDLAGFEQPADTLGEQPVVGTEVRQNRFNEDEEDEQQLSVLTVHGYVSLACSHIANIFIAPESFI